MTEIDDLIADLQENEIDELNQKIASMECNSEINLARLEEHAYIEDFLTEKGKIYHEQEKKLQEFTQKEDAWKVKEEEHKKTLKDSKNGVWALKEIMEEKEERWKRLN